MADCNSLQTIFNSFLQLTPLVQVLLVLLTALTISSVFYCIKEIIAHICNAIVRRKHGFEDGVYEFSRPRRK